MPGVVDPFAEVESQLRWWKFQQIPEAAAPEELKGYEDGRIYRHSGHYTVVRPTSHGRWSLVYRSPNPMQIGLQVEWDAGAAFIPRLLKTLAIRLFADFALSQGCTLVFGWESVGMRSADNERLFHMLTLSKQVRFVANFGGNTESIRCEIPYSSAIKPSVIASCITALSDRVLKIAATYTRFATKAPHVHMDCEDAVRCLL